MIKSTRGAAQGPETRTSPHRLNCRESGCRTGASGTYLRVLSSEQGPKEVDCYLQAGPGSVSTPLWAEQKWASCRKDPVVSSWGGVGGGWGVRDLRGNRSDGQIRGPVQCDPAGPGRPDKCTPCPCCPSTKSKRGESLFPWLLWYRDPVHQNKLTQGPRTCMGR